MTTPTDPAESTGQFTWLSETMTVDSRPRWWHPLRDHWLTIPLVGLLLWFGSTQVLFPGQIRVLASSVCDAEHPDMFVTKERLERRPGMRRRIHYRHVVWCMAPDGDRERHSAFQSAYPLIPPYLLIAAGGYVVAPVVKRTRAGRSGAKSGDAVDPANATGRIPRDDRQEPDQLISS